MKQRSMSTARGVALVRALEMTRPETDRVSTDPYAAFFVNPLTLAAMRLYRATGLAHLIGVEPMMNFAIVRERIIADLMEREAADGIEQIVILGAGFDTRAYRLKLNSVPVFEVDHPVTQRQKGEALAHLRDTVPPTVHFVAVDFEIDDLGERLTASGYDATKRTLFVWQGVIVYLTADGIDRTIAFISNHSAPGSLVVFDYFDAAEMKRGGSPAIRFFASMMGEMVRFAIAHSDVRQFLETRGFGDVTTMDDRGMAEPFPGRPIAKGVGIAMARVR